METEDIYSPITALVSLDGAIDRLIDETSEMTLIEALVADLMVEIDENSIIV